MEVEKKDECADDRDDGEDAVLVPLPPRRAEDEGGGGAMDAAVVVAARPPQHPSSSSSLYVSNVQIVDRMSVVYVGYIKPQTYR